MKISLLQTDIIWESPAPNRERIAELIRDNEDSDVVILPEMFTTGFTMSPSSLAEQELAPTLDWMLRLARLHDVAIAGSTVTRGGGRYFNRLWFVRPDGTHDFYDKRHLFAYAGEEREYTAGSERKIVEYKGVRILLQICYDLRFPVFSRNRGDYDMILYSANWPESRIGVWDTLLRARAIENVCYVAGVNRTGSDPNGKYPGHTALIDFKGNPVASARTEAEEVVTGYLEMARLSEFRQKFPVLHDADRFTLDLD